MRNVLLRDVNATLDYLEGQCPVVGRWNQWQLVVGDSRRPQFLYGEPCGDAPGDAGYLEEREAVLMIVRGLEAYRAWEGTNVQEGDA